MKRHRLIKTATTALAIIALNACEKDPIPVGPGPANPGSGTVTAIEPIIPAHEMRGVWVATVSGIDWPQGKYDEASQKALYTQYLDRFESLNINTIFFQVRPSADAFYNSQYEPWSRYITNTAGKDPGYDLLNFLIEETHKRGMEFHAWLNPYRIATRSSASASFPALDSKIPSSMVKDYQRIRVYNPALPEVRQRIADIVKDLIVRYDIDGIHMDDYFYPSLQSGEAMDDAEEFAKYGGSFTDIKDWRRNNVTLMVTAIHDVIRATREDVTFTISPQGNYDNNYNTQYIDIPTVCRKGLIDIVIPQLYWSTTSSTKDYFTPRLDWFSSNIGNCKMMVGYAAYRFDGSDTYIKAGFDSSEQLNIQINLAAKKPNVVGGIYYNANSVYRNLMDINSVMLRHYSQKALEPCVRLGKKGPDKGPQNVSITGGTISWDSVAGAEYYAVYRSNGDKKVASLVGTTGETSLRLNASSDGKTAWFVTALTEFHAESPRSELVTY